MKPFTVYMLHCADDSYYVGHTDDLAVRLRQHQDGEEGYTSTRRPLALAWTGEFETRDGALAFERQVKGWSRAKKEALMRGDWEGVQALARNGVERGLRQAQPEREGQSPELTSTVRPEPPTTVRPEPPTTVRPEPVEGLLRLRSQTSSSEAGLRQAQPERGEVSAPPSVRAEPTLSFHAEPTLSVHPEPVEGPKEPWLRQAQPEREGGRTAPSVHPEPVEGPIDPLFPALLGTHAAPRRRAIAKTITLLESTRADHRQRADALLNALLPHTGRSFRLGISGVPGVGKSTFIEALGLHLIALGHRVAVLAVDPSSSVSGGSILGDKTRMEQLSVNESAYIRPSPSSGTLGGVAERTREAMLVCEAAGYDVVIVETVGVGQSETAVAGMTDMFVLMQLPNAGDDLQAIKKGVMEIADLVVINKADLDEAAATRARAQISSAQRLFHGHGMAHPEPGAPEQWQPTVIQLSALKAQGVDSFWQTVQRFRTLRAAAGQIAARRQRQDEAWMWERLDAGLKARFRAHPGVREQLAPLTAAVRAGELAASVAARRLLDLLDQR